MKNNQSFPFERNRYYSGKLLTSSDFEAEQNYMNGKRHFLNHIMFGNGVVCGLNVVNLDDQSILIESGMALDEFGHEIVVPSTVIKRLSVIEGFDRIDSDEVGLYIRYREESVHSVYCGDMGGNGSEYENNRIDEQFDFYLDSLDSIDVPTMPANKIFLEEKVLDNEDYSIVIRMPYTASKGKAVKIEVNTLKKSAADKNLNFQARLQLPAFMDYEGAHELEINVENINLDLGERTRQEYWVNTDLSDAKEANIIGRREDMRFSIGGYEAEPSNGINFKLLLSYLSPDKLSLCEVGKINLESTMDNNVRDGVCIAKISLIRTDSNALISEITERGIKRYVRTPARLGQRQKFRSYFKDRLDTGKKALTLDKSVTGTKGDIEFPVFMTSGRLEIPLDVNMKKGDVCYSEEIMHGLGKGNVYVEVGIEYIDDTLNKNSRKNTIYGDPSLFDMPECMETQTAVRVFNDKGSFQVAVKLLGEQKSIVIQLNWVAMRFSTSKDASEMQDEDDRSIIPDTPTVRLKAKESYYFNVNFNNMKPCRLSYELTEAGSGEIGADGMYTAPSKEGVYEIYIYCTDMPKISTYVYAIVSK